jgi:xanthosine utilization system XapX-like protein
MQSEPAATAPARRRRPGWRAAILAVIMLVAAAVGAYLDWIWWPVYSGLMITIVAVGLLVVGGIAAIVPVRIVRPTGLAILAVAVGLLLGQNLGPSREPLIQQFGGTITLRLERPVAAVATGPVDCTNVASETEFNVTSDPNLRLDTPERPFVSIGLDKGDRWAVRRDVPRNDGVRLFVTVTSPLVLESKPSTLGMEATQASTLEATFRNDGGSARFAGLAPMTGIDYSGESMDLAGTIEWTCGEPFAGD